MTSLRNYSGFPGEMADSTTGTGHEEDESVMSCLANKKGCCTRTMSKGQKCQYRGSYWTNTGNPSYR